MTMTKATDRAAKNQRTERRDHGRRRVTTRRRSKLACHTVVVETSAAMNTTEHIMHDIASRRRHSNRKKVFELKRAPKNCGVAENDTNCTITGRITDVAISDNPRRTIHVT
jgi:ribosomal protein S8E